MFSWIKELLLLVMSALSLVGILILFYMLIFGTCSASGQGIPIRIDPNSERVIFLVDYDSEFNLDHYIDKSNETGLYPDWGWTGEYYITGVTHGAVYDEYSPDFSKGGYNSSVIENSRSIGTVVPEPSSVTAGIIFFVLYLLRRDRG